MPRPSLARYATQRKPPPGTRNGWIRLSHGSCLERRTVAARRDESNWRLATCTRIVLTPPYARVRCWLLIATMTRAMRVEYAATCGVGGVPEYLTVPDALLTFFLYRPGEVASSRCRHPSQTWTTEGQNCHAVSVKVSNPCRLSMDGTVDVCLSPGGHGADALHMPIVSDEGGIRVTRSASVQYPRRSSYLAGKVTSPTYTARRTRVDFGSWRRAVSHEWSSWGGSVGERERGWRSSANYMYGSRPQHWTRAKF